MSRLNSSWNAGKAGFPIISGAKNKASISDKLDAELQDALSEEMKKRGLL